MSKELTGVTIKRNKSGGLYVRHPNFIEYSEDKNKEYINGVNIPMNTAKQLFSNKTLLNAIQEFVQTEEKKVTVKA